MVGSLFCVVALYRILLQPGDFLDLETIPPPSNDETKHPVSPCHNTPPYGTGLDEQSVSCFFSRCFIWCI